MKPQHSLQFMFCGVLVFLTGLLMGLCLYFGLFPNGRIGLVAHLEGVMNGMFLMLVGSMWLRLRLSPLMQNLARFFALAGAFMNIFQAAWWAFLGRAFPSPVYAVDRPPMAVEYVFLQLILPALAACFILCCVVLLWGLWQAMAEQRTAPAVQQAI